MKRGLVLCICLLAASVPPVRALPTPTLRISLVTVSQADDDPTLVQDAVRGLHEAQAAFGRRITTQWIPLLVHRLDIGAAEAAHAYFAGALGRAARSSDLVIAWGDLLTDSAVETAIRFPAVRFVLVSTISVERIPPNLSEGTLHEMERAFFGGAVAALASRSHTIGFIRSVDDGIKLAYTEGASQVVPTTRILYDFLGFSVARSDIATGQIPGSWRSAGYAGAADPASHNPLKAAEVALAQFDLGADVIYTAAGASDAGTFRAAAARGKWVVATGGPYTERALPQPLRNRILAMITERRDATVYRLLARYVSDRPLPPHFRWGVVNAISPENGSGVALAKESSLAHVPLLGVIVNPRMSAHTAQLTSILADMVREMREHRINLP